MIHSEFVLPASFEDSPQVAYVIMNLFGLHHDIINITFQVIVQHAYNISAITC